MHTGQTLLSNCQPPTHRRGRPASELSARLSSLTLRAHRPTVAALMALGLDFALAASSLDADNKSNNNNSASGTSGGAGGGTRGSEGAGPSRGPPSSSHRPSSRASALSSIDDEDGEGMAAGGLLGGGGQGVALGAGAGAAAATPKVLVRLVLEMEELQVGDGLGSHQGPSGPGCLNPFTPASRPPWHPPPPAT